MAPTDVWCDPVFPPATGFAVGVTTGECAAHFDLLGPALEFMAELRDAGCRGVLGWVTHDALDEDGLTADGREVTAFRSVTDARVVCEALWRIVDPAEAAA